MLEKIIFVIISYLLGSIPFGFLIAYSVKKIDIRNFGSGNIGATNITRVIGKRFGVLVFVLDFLKVFLPVYLAILFFRTPPRSSIEYELSVMLVAFVGICGHNWPIFLKFRGGKGVTATLAVLIALALVFNRLWIIIILAIFSWVIIFLITRYVSIASLFASIIFFIFSLFLLQQTTLKIFLLLLLLLIIIRHRKNIKNLVSHKEYRF